MLSVFSKPEVWSFPPPISLFVKFNRASAKKESADHHEFKVKFDPSVEHSQKTKKSMPIFEDDNAEMWCEYHSQLIELVRLVRLSSGRQKQQGSHKSLARKGA
jgi:hypothetical protein